MQQKDTTDHLMALVQQYPTGWEECACPACGRRFIIHWPPERSKIVLDEGNPKIDHIYVIETEENKKRLKYANLQVPNLYGSGLPAIEGEPRHCLKAIKIFLPRSHLPS